MQVFFRMPSIGIVDCFFPLMSRVIRLWDVKCHFTTSYQGYIYQHDFSLIDSELDHLADSVYDFSTVNDFLKKSPFPFCTLWKEITMCSPHLIHGDFMLLFFQNRIFTLIIWNCSIREICLLSPTFVFIQSFIYILMDTYFILWVIISTTLFCYLNCPRLGHWEFFLCSLTYSH